MSFRFTRGAATIFSLVLIQSSCAAPDGLPILELPDAGPEPAHYTWVSRDDDAKDSAGGVTWPERVSYELRLDDMPLRLELTRNDRLFGDDYAEVRIGAGGEPVEHPRSEWADVDHCLYQGVIIEVDSAGLPLPAHSLNVVSVQTCDETGRDLITGLMNYNGRLWAIDPTGSPSHSGSGEQILHQIQPVENLIHNVDDPYSCGLEGIEAHAIALPEGLEGDQLPAPPATMWVQEHVTNNYRQEAAHGANTETVAATIFNNVHTMYAGASFASAVNIVLAGQVTYTSAASDPFTPTPDGNDDVSANTLLTNITNNDNRTLPEHDNRHVLDGGGFQGSTVGLAWVDTMCNATFSAGVTTALSTTNGTSVVVAHEMGHNFLFNHDGDIGCSNGTNIMSAFVPCSTCDPFPGFSSCTEGSSPPSPTTRTGTAVC